MSCPVNNPAFVIPSEAKESLCEIAASLKLLAMTMYRNLRGMRLDRLIIVPSLFYFQLFSSIFYPTFIPGACPWESMRIGYMWI